MPTKRYKLLQNHPYAKKGTIVEERGRNTFRAGLIDLISPESIFSIPLDVEHDWLEEVKEEPMCSKEFAEAISAYIKEHGNDGWVWTGESKSFKCWLERHTSKE